MRNQIWANVAGPYQTWGRAMEELGKLMEGGQVDLGETCYTIRSVNVGMNRGKRYYVSRPATAAENADYGDYMHNARMDK